MFQGTFTESPQEAKVGCCKSCFFCFGILLLWCEAQISIGRPDAVVPWHSFQCRATTGLWKGNAVGSSRTRWVHTVGPSPITRRPLLLFTHIDYKDHSCCLNVVGIHGGQGRLGTKSSILVLVLHFSYIFRKGRIFFPTSRRKHTQEPHVCHDLCWRPNERHTGGVPPAGVSLYRIKTLVNISPDRLCGST